MTASFVKEFVPKKNTNLRMVCLPHREAVGMYGRMVNEMKTLIPLEEGADRAYSTMVCMYVCMWVLYRGHVYCLAHV